MANASLPEYAETGSLMVALIQEDRESECEGKGSSKDILGGFIQPRLPVAAPYDVLIE